MPIVPGFIHQGQLEEEVKRAMDKLGPEAVHVSYRVGADSTGEPSIFLQVIRLLKVREKSDGYIECLASSKEHLYV